MSESYIVTGGSGFIGSNIVIELVRRKKKVKVIDNLSTGNRQNLDSVADKIKFVEGSITDLDLLQKEFQGATYILHQAALPSVPRSVADPLASNETNITGSLNVLIAARDNGIKRVVYAGSSSSYGNAEVEYKSEDLPSDPLSPYALTKYTAEIYCQLFYSLYKLETVTLRYFNVFGRHQNPDSQYAAVIPKFITSMLKGESPVIMGDGEQSRDFTYVGNNVEANILAATSDKGAGDVINIACGESTTLNELVAMINTELGTHISPVYQGQRPGDVKHSKADITKAQNILGYKPLMTFEEGLKETVAWYKKQK
jgi:nucleoside-diphosphate-sugar epimerase